MKLNYIFDFVKVSHKIYNKSNNLLSYKLLCY